MNMNTLSKEQIALCSKTIRFLSADMVQKANSGHPGAPMGLAELAFTVWASTLRFNPSQPEWIGRDRFILSNGHASALLYSLLHLFGYDCSLDDCKQFRQWNSRTAGHPEYGHLPGIETTTGPLGQGVSYAVGMAIANKLMKARFTDGAYTPFDNRIITIVGDGDLMEGISSEASSLAGHYQLDNLICLYDSNSISIEGSTTLSFTEDIVKRFEAQHWHVIKGVDGHNHESILQALEQAQKNTNKPTLIEVNTIIGYGSPHLAGTAKTHGSPLGEQELRLAKEQANWPHQEPFYIPEEAKQTFTTIVADKNNAYQAWQEQYDAWIKENPQQEKELEKYSTYPDIDAYEEIAAIIEELPKDPIATRSSGGKILNKLAKQMPQLVGGSADLAPSNNSYLDEYNDISADDFSGRNIRFGVREHAMAAITNGITTYGGLRGYCATFLVFSDYMRPSIRLAALMKTPSIFILTHDSIFLGEDGPTHQPIEHLWALRAIPGLTVFRPADTLETAMAYYYAARLSDGPTALALTRQKTPQLERMESFMANDVLKGGYVLVESKNANVTLVATGSEVSLAIETATELQQSHITARVISMPSVDLFLTQNQEYQDSVLGTLPLVSIEAGSTLGWYRLLGANGLAIGIDHFGASAPASKLAQEFGFTPQQVASKITAHLKD